MLHTCISLQGSIDLIIKLQRIPLLNWFCRSGNNILPAAFAALGRNTFLAAIRPHWTFCDQMRVTRNSSKTGNPSVWRTSSSHPISSSCKPIKVCIWGVVAVKPCYTLFFCQGCCVQIRFSSNSQKPETMSCIHAISFPVLLSASPTWPTGRDESQRSPIFSHEQMGLTKLVQNHQVRHVGLKDIRSFPLALVFWRDFTNSSQRSSTERWLPRMSALSCSNSEDLQSSRCLKTNTIVQREEIVSKYDLQGTQTQQVCNFPRPDTVQRTKLHNRTPIQVFMIKLVR